MEDTKTFAEWEVAHGVMVEGATQEQLDTRMTAQQFRDLWEDSVPKGMNHSGRIEFLRANGYEVNRANMLDGTLSTKQAE